MVYIERRPVLILFDIHASRAFAGAARTAA
jgi:hypothetical protein